MTQKGNQKKSSCAKVELQHPLVSAWQTSDQLRQFWWFLRVLSLSYRKLVSAACILLAAKISSDLKKQEVKHLIDVRHTHIHGQLCFHLLRYFQERSGNQQVCNLHYCRHQLRSVAGTSVWVNSAPSVVLQKRHKALLFRLCWSQQTLIFICWRHVETITLWLWAKLWWVLCFLLKVWATLVFVPSAEAGGAFPDQQEGADLLWVHHPGGPGDGALSARE